MFLCTFFLAIVLSVLLRYTDSDYPFGIFKLFSQSAQYRCLYWNYILNTISYASAGSCSLICNNGLEFNYPYIVIRKNIDTKYIVPIHYG